MFQQIRASQQQVHVVVRSIETSSYLMYFDVNNLYGWAMCQPLLYADFRWVDDTSNFNIMNITLDSPTGYILEVDLEYPQHLPDARQTTRQAAGQTPRNSIR